MFNYYLKNEPEWETTEHGWHAVVAPAYNTPGWMAYIEDAVIPNWRVWAGCLFETSEEAQNWCHYQISQQVNQNFGALSEDDHSKDHADNLEWHWFWGDLEFMHNNEFMAY